MTTGVASARDLVRQATARLEKAGVPEPVASAEVLLSELLGVGRAMLPLVRESLTEDEAKLYGTWILRRLNREPVQRILGHAYFRNLRLELDEHTLIPRSDTESVVEAALERIDRRGGSCRVLDLGTGSGAIAISIAQERPACEVHATDTSQAALQTARRNAEANETTVHFHQVDVATNLEALRESISVLVSNPPYIPSAEINGLAPEVRDWDPLTALDGGPDGLDFYRRILTETPPLLERGADVVLEVGDGQTDDVLALGEAAGFTTLGSHKDLAGSERAVIFRWSA